LDNKISQITAHPFLFILFPILFLYSNNIHLLTFDGIILPLIGALFVGFVLWIILRLILKHSKKSAILVSLYVVLFFSYGHIYNLFKDVPSQFFEVRHEHLLIPFFAFFGIGTYFIVKSKRPFNNATTILNTISIILVVMIMVNIVNYNFSSSLINNDIGIISNEKISIDYAPDIYYLVFDAYPNHNTLSKFFDYDNREFISYLTERGFYVFDESYSNYVETFLSLSSSLNMKHVNDLSSIVGINSIDQKIPYKMLNNNFVMQNLKNKGYEIISFDSGYWGTNGIEVADKNLCSNIVSIDSTYLSYLKRTTMLDAFDFLFLSDAQDFRAEDVRERILCQFSELSKIKDSSEKPVFVFDHFVSPHGPYVFGSNGEAVSYVILEELSPQERKKVFVDQIIFINKKIQKIVDELILESENPPIVIIQSDHGIDVKDWGLTDEESHTFERHRNLNAFYFPDKKYDLIYDELTPVNTFRLVFNTFHNDNFPFVDDTLYYSPFSQPYNFTDVTKIFK
jgi:hypothetical protein